MENKGKYAIGIDLGGTSIKGGLVTCSGEIIARMNKPTPQGASLQAIFAGIEEIISNLIGSLDEEDRTKLVGVGIGVPGCIDPYAGKVLEVSGNIAHWTGAEIKKTLENTYPDLPVFVENDANAAALGELWQGSGQKFDSFVMLTLGTGVGSAYLSKDQGLLRGSHFQGGEFGHSILYPHGRQCNCGQKGCVDKYISGRSIEDHYAELTGQRLSGAEIFALLKNKEDGRSGVGSQDPRPALHQATESKSAGRLISSSTPAEDIVLERFCQDLALALVSVKNIFDPEAIIIGGGLIQAKEVWWDKALEYFHAYVNDGNKTVFQPASQLNNAGLLGAAYLVFHS